MRFNFSTTINIAEYEDLIVRLKITKKLSAEKVKVFSNSTRHEPSAK